MTNFYDVIIVGAGPAGLSTGMYCLNGVCQDASNPPRVLIIDENPVIGVPVVCGEAINKTLLDHHHLPHEGDHIATKITHVRLVTPKGREIRLELKHTCGYVLNRDKFEQLLVKECKAMGKGVEVMNPARVVRLEPPSTLAKTVRFNPPATVVLSDGTKIEGRIIVGADGMHSVIAKGACFDTELEPEDICGCAQWYCQDVDVEPHTLHVILSPKYSPGGYVWVFPKDDMGKTANIGCGGIAHAPYKKLIEQFIEDKYPGAHKERYCGGCIPLAKPRRKLIGAYNNVALVGDSARQVFAHTGGGIATSMQAGKVLGYTIAKYLQGEITCLQPYEDEMNRTLNLKLLKAYGVKQKLYTGDKYLDRLYWMLKAAVAIHSIAPKWVEEKFFKNLRY